MNTNNVGWTGKWVGLLILLVVVVSILNPVSIVQSGTRGVLTTFG